jgi:hypothetical protein
MSTSMEKRTKFGLSLLALASLFSCTINSGKTIDIGAGISLLTSIREYAEKNPLTGKNYTLEFSSYVYASSTSEEEKEAPLSTSTTTYLYDSAQTYYLAYQKDGVSKSFRVDEGGNYLITEDGVSRAYSTEKDGAMATFLDLPAYFDALTLAFCDCSAGYLNLVSNNQKNPLTFYSLTSSGGGSLGVHIAGDKLDFNACFSGVDSLIDGNLSLVKGNLSGSYLTSLVGYYPILSNGSIKQGKCAMSLKYNG